MIHSWVVIKRRGGFVVMKLNKGKNFKAAHTVSSLKMMMSSLVIQRAGIFLIKMSATQNIGSKSGYFQNREHLETLMYVGGLLFLIKQILYNPLSGVHETFSGQLRLIKRLREKTAIH